MPVGDCQRAFAAAAEADGVQLGPSRLPWINQRGHFGLPPEGRVARAPLEAIFTALGGDSAAQAAKRTTPLTGDFTETSTGTLIEIDESQHFTSFRALSLRLYPSDVRVSFDRNHYMDLCRELAPRSDRYRASKAAVGFGPGGRQRQRAYHDALRDLAAPACGRPPVIRVAVLDNDGAGAYSRERDRIRDLLADGGQQGAPDSDPPDLAASIEELRSLLQAFDDVETEAMSAPFHAHAYNELDIAGRAVIDAFDAQARLESPTVDPRGTG